MSTIASLINKFSSPVAFVSGVEVAATAAVEVSLKLVPIGRRGGVYPVPVELIDHRGRRHRSSVHHRRAQLKRGEDGSQLQQTDRGDSVSTFLRRHRSLDSGAFIIT